MKSNVSDLMEAVQAVYHDACAKCIADVSDLRDLETILSRVENLGASFLTITLPSFARDFERSLDQGWIDPSSFRSFKKLGRIPAFLSVIVGQIFNKRTGRIYDEKESPEWDDFPTLIEAVRQICLTFKKLEDVCKPSRVAEAFRNFSTIEHDFQVFNPSPEEKQEFISVASLLWSDCIRSIRICDLLPRHGPGATADRISGNQKYRWLTWYERLEPFFPCLSNGFPLGAYDSREFERVRYVSVDDEVPVKVIAVPKTMKSPRIIAIEPACMQYAQHAIQSALQSAIESSRFAGGQVNFTDQSVNQGLALKSSKDGSHATIDLSDASDRVPLDLAMCMFDTNPDLRDGILACRSTRAKLPNGTIIGPLRKFASMGSALCFPVESMYFYTICVMAQLKEQHLPLSTASLQKVCKRTYIYGDDIVVPTDQAIIVLEYLQKYNCKVNANKTFYGGNFRESCGVDAFRGYEVTPTYIGTHCPKDRQQVSEIVSWASTANLFYKRGYWRTAFLMFSKLEKIVGQLPYVSDRSPALGRVSFLGSRYSTSSKNVRYLEKPRDLTVAWYQRMEIKALVPGPVYRSDMIDGYSALGKSLSLAKPFDLLEGLRMEEDHLERTALPGAVSLKHRWVPAT